MPLGEILLHVDDAPSFPSRAAAAVGLAERYSSHLVGVGIRQPIATTIGLEGVPTSIFAELEALRERAIEQDAQRFREVVQRAGLEANAEWRVGEGTPLNVLDQQARYADMTVVSQGEALRGASGEIEFPGDLAIASGRPVLAIPFIGAREPIGRHVLIAWNGSREAARAVSDAMGLLQEAEEVRIVSVSEAGRRDTVGNDLARHLARHGIAAEVDAMSPSGLEIGQLLLNCVMERGSDLLVMGAYGHTRWREAILGGATRTLLRQMTVPVLMSH